MSLLCQMFHYTSYQKVLYSWFVQNVFLMIGIASWKKSWGMIWFMIHPVLFSNSSLLFDYGMVLFIKAQKRLWHLGLMNCCVVMSLTLYYLEYFAELHDDDLDRLLNHNRMGSRRRRRPILTIFWAEEVVVAEAVGNSYSYFDKEQLLDNSNFVVVICDCCML